MMGPVREHLTWENFENHFLHAGAPGVHVIPGEPRAEIFVEARGAQIGLRIDVVRDTRVAELPLRQIQVATRSISNRNVIEVFTDSEDLYRPFFSVLTEIADAIQIDHVPLPQAVMAAVARLARLVEERPRLTEEKLRGLIGELWVLDELISRTGPSAVAAWVGHEAECHDFRLPTADLEVKTTAETRRMHVISSVQQLVANMDRPLFLVSLHLVRTGQGEGLRLASILKSIRRRLPVESQERRRLEEALATIGYHDVDAGLYPSAYHFRSSPIAYEVIRGFPRIDPARLQEAVGVESFDRLDRVSYRINLEGLPCEVNASDLLEQLTSTGGTTHGLEH